MEGTSNLFNNTSNQALNRAAPQFGSRRARIFQMMEKYKGNRPKQLAIAGALIAAEIDRLQRI